VIYLNTSKALAYY